MKQSGISRLFIMVCVAVLLASYGVGLGVKKVRFAAAETKAPVADTVKSADKSDSDNEEVTAEAGASEPSEQVAAEPPAESADEVAARPERPGGRRGMTGEGSRERFQNMTDEQRQEFMARARERGGRTRGGGGAFMQMSEEDRASFRAEMEELNAGSADMSDEERQQARDKILEKYGLPTGGGGGRGRRGGRQ